MNIQLVNTKIRESRIVRKTTFKGLGLHTGKTSFLTISDNPKNDGIIFIYKGIRKKIKPEILNTKEKTTSIIHNKKVFIICIEHLMSSLCGLGILNAIIELSGGREIPILFGNSFSFVEKLLPNIRMVTIKNTSVIIKKTITIFDDSDKDRYIRLSPSKETFLQIRSSISYIDSHTQEQHFEFDFKNSKAYVKEISHARTSFPFKINDRKVFLQLIKRLKGIVVTGKNRNVNIYPSNNTLKTYYNNEIARHKILDFLGDFKTAGIDLMRTKIELHKTGHSLNIKLARLLREEFERKNKSINLPSAL